MTVSSSALLCQVTVPSALLETDKLLEMILLKLVSSLQVKVNVAQNKASPLEMTFSDQTFTQRNVILKTLVGFIGVKQNQSGRSLLSHPTTPICSAALTAWMSVADSVRKNNSAEDLLMNLDAHLETHAFLLPTSHTASLADLDLALQLLDRELEACKALDNVYRWLQTCHTMLADFGCKGLATLDAKRPAYPIFFTGTEDESLVLKPKSNVPPVKGAAPKPQGKPDKPQKAKKEEQKKTVDKQQLPKQQQQQAQQSDPVDFNVSALDIRVGKILKSWHHPEADKLFCEEIDLGNGEVRQIASGLRPFYQTEDLTGRSVLVLCNLKKRNLVGFPSHGMVLCASNADHTQVKFVTPPAGASPGDRVVFGDITGEPEPETKIAKKKIFEKLAPDLKTNDQGSVVWKDAVATVGGANVTAELTGAHVS